jgi:fibronectin-binding autotransporter adhesin
MKTTKHATKTLITLSAFTLMGSLTYGANIFWIGDTDGAWEDTGNWSTTTGGSGGADPSNNQLFIEGTTNPDVTLSSVDAVTRVLIDQGRTLYIASGGTLTGTNSIAVIGDNSLGNLVVQDGGTYNRTGTLDTRFGTSSVTVEDGGTINLGNWSAEGSGGFNISGSTADVTIGNITTTGNGVDNSTLTLNSASLSVTGNMTWDGAGSSALSIGAGSTLNLTGAAASHTLTDGIEITGGGQVNLSGTLDANANTINITGANSTFQLGSGGTGGAINTSSSVTIGSGGTFVINQSDAVTQGTEFGDSISGAGSIEQAGTGTTTLNVANSHTGGTTLSSGTLVLGDAAAAGTGAITLSGGTLEIAANIANDISAAGSTTIVNNTGTLSLNGGSVTGTGTLAFSVASQTRLFSDLSGFSGTISHDNDAGGQLRLWNQPTDLSGTKIVTSGGTSGGGLLLINGGNDHTIGELSGTGGTILMRGGNGLTLTVDQSTDTTYSGLLQDGDANRIGTLVKDGTGSLTLGFANTYTGTTTINAGTLSLASGSSHSGSGDYTVNGGILEIATGVDLSGHDMTIAGVISPGNSPGTAATGAQTWLDGGSYLWEINNSAGIKGVDEGWDWLSITGALDLTNLGTGGFTIDIDSLSLANSIGDAAGFESWSKGDGLVDYSFIIATFDSLTDDYFDAGDFILDSSGFSNGPSWDWQIKLSGSDLVLEAYAVPEPSSTALLGLGGLALALRRRR